jgi:fructose-1,6-bisphosphatase/inositol monophosphatase family enzyme
MVGRSRRTRWASAVEAALRAAAAAVRRTDPRRGQRVVAGRAEGYRPFDPEVIGVDTAAEKAAIGALRGAGVHGTLLSEEAGERPLARRRTAAAPEPVYVVMDPFDGSMLYRRGIRAMWYTGIGLWALDGAPRAAGLVDHVTGELVLSDGAEVRRWASPRARPERPRPAATGDIESAFLEAYMMKPAFLYPTAEALRPLLGRARFVLPNGGPGGFVDVACGRIDVYLAWREALTEVFSTVGIALAAGCIVSGWDGAPLVFRPDINALHTVVCSANPRLHAEVLRVLEGVTPPGGIPA